MDWMKKWFPSSDKKDAKEHEQFQNEHSQKDIQTKMTFKYPDKELQIPAIERKKKRSGSHRETILRQTEQSDRQEKNVTDLQEHNKNHRHVKNDSYPSTNRKWKIFQAEPVPSPIYGYRRRTEKNEAPIEFELSPFEINVQMKENDVSPIHKLTDQKKIGEENHSKEQITVEKSQIHMEKMTREPLFRKTEFVDEKQSTNKRVLTDATVAKTPLNQEEKGKSTNLNNQVARDGTFSHERSSSSENGKIRTEGDEKCSSVKKVNREEKRLSSIDPVDEQWNMNRNNEEKLPVKSGKVEDQFEEEKANLSNNPEQNVSTPLNTDDPMRKEQDDQTDFRSPSNRSDRSNSLEAKGEESTPKEHSFSETVKEKKGKTQSDQPPKRKKTVPFNVLMLKSDREKLRKRMENIPDIKTTTEEMNESLIHEEKSYRFPPIRLLRTPVEHSTDTEWVSEQVKILNDTLRSFHVSAKVVSTSEGPSVTRFEISPEMGVKVNKITNLTDDLKLSLAAKDIRIEAPIPGKHTIGIEVPNVQRRPVFLREIIEQQEYIDASSPLTVAVGLDIAGKPVITDLKKMPHGLIAGATGSGKSVCINTFIISLLYKARPDEVKLLMIDPKMVELAPYNGIPHLISPVITDVKAATQALKWAVEEMERRYERFAEKGVRDIERFNEKEKEKLPFIVIIIDELADLMMMAPADVEDAICRIAQKARACGIHLLIATQRPSVDVITGLIKANVPTRIAFSVSSQVDSRTIIDISGAERLLGKGDMLFLENGTSKPVRLQGPFISDDEIESVVEHVRKEGEPEYLFQQEELIKKSDMADQDELFLEACEFAVQHGSISTSSLQRRFRIGYNRAARLIELMEEKGIITEQRGSKPRDVLITEQDLHQFNE